MGVFESSIPLLYEAAGYPETLYSYFLSANNLVSIFLPGMISYLAVRCDHYKIDYIAIGISILGALLLGYTKNAWFLIAAALLLVSGRSCLNCSFGNIVNVWISSWIVVIMAKDAFAPISFAYFYDCFQGEQAAEVMGLTTSVGNAFSLVMPLVIGWLWSVSTTFVFVLGAVCNLLAAAVVIVMLPNVKSASEPNIMGQR